VPGDPQRCSTMSLSRDEAMSGTASTVRSWLLLEHAGPWGRDALVDARLPGGLGPELRRRTRRAAVRAILIRRIHRRPAEGAMCFVVRSGPDEPWVERVRLPSIGDALTLDLDALGRGDRLGLEPSPDPLFLVCTHGRHDACCAERGRPVAGSLAEAYPEATWECSHIGGDRFAANVVALPHGLYFGRLDAHTARVAAAAYADGRIDLAYLRGRSTRTMPVQAAEHALRVQEELEGIDDVRVEATVTTGDGVLVTMWTRRGRFDVRIATELAPPRRLTCRSAVDEAPPAYRTVSIERRLEV
jgi:hypothetical protein